MRSRPSAYRAHHNPEPLDEGVIKAIFPGQHCTKCTLALVPGTEIVLDPDNRGPKGGKRYMHAHGCTKSNPAKRRVKARDLNDTDDMTPSERAEMEMALRDYYTRQAAAKRVAVAASKVKAKQNRSYPRYR